MYNSTSYNYNYNYYRQLTMQIRFNLLSSFINFKILYILKLYVVGYNNITMQFNLKKSKTTKTNKKANNKKTQKM